MYTAKHLSRITVSDLFYTLILTLLIIAIMWLTSHLAHESLADAFSAIADAIANYFLAVVTKYAH